MANLNIDFKKYKNLILFLIVLVGIGLAVKFIFLPLRSGDSGQKNASNQAIIDGALNIKVNALTAGIFDLPKFKALKFYEFKLKDFGEIKKNNRRPFEPVGDDAGVAD